MADKGDIGESSQAGPWRVILPDSVRADCFCNWMVSIRSMAIIECTGAFAGTIGKHDASGESATGCWTWGFT